MQMRRLNEDEGEGKAEEREVTLRELRDSGEREREGERRGERASHDKQGKREKEREV